MKYLLIVCAAILALSLLFCSFNGEAFRDGFIRLHILAASDTDKDQAEKLLLRDAILDRFGAELADSETKREAEKKIADILVEINGFANAFLREQGSANSCNVELCNEYYGTRQYEEVALPAGQYKSLRVIIGDGSGQNWWCVLFPPICLAAATEREEREEAYLAAGLTPEEYRVITNNRRGVYRLRFKIIDFFGSLAKHF